MTANPNTTPPGGAEQPNVSALHEKWLRIVERINTMPAVLNQKRENEFTTAVDLEKQIAALPSRIVGEICTKISMARKCLGDREEAMIDSALGDLHRIDQDMPVPAP